MERYLKKKPLIVGPGIKTGIKIITEAPKEIGADLARSFTTYYDFYKLRQHVPSDKVIEFVNLDRKEDSIRTAGRIKLPTYNPYGIKNR